MTTTKLKIQKQSSSHSENPISATLGSPLIKIIQINDDDGSCTPRPRVDRDNDGEKDFGVTLLFRERNLDLYESAEALP